MTNIDQLTKEINELIAAYDEAEANLNGFAVSIDETETHDVIDVNLLVFVNKDIDIQTNEDHIKAIIQIINQAVERAGYRTGGVLKLSISTTKSSFIEKLLTAGFIAKL